VQTGAGVVQLPRLMSMSSVAPIKQLLRRGHCSHDYVWRNFGPRAQSVRHLQHADISSRVKETSAKAIP
jgi:hypothetical protein